MKKMNYWTLILFMLLQITSEFSFKSSEMSFNRKLIASEILTDKLHTKQ